MYYIFKNDLFVSVNVTKILLCQETKETSDLTLKMSTLRMSTHFLESKLLIFTEQSQQ